MLTEERDPASPADWRPFFEKALKAYVMEQRGGVTLINCRNLVKFLKSRPGYPPIETEEQETHVTRLLKGFFTEYIGPLWDGAIYVDTSGSKGRSLVVGTDNLLALIRFKGRVVDR